MSCRRRSGGLGAACLLLSLLAGAALASTLGEAALMEQLRAPDLVRAEDAATLLGRRGSEAALEVILERADPKLIRAYAVGASWAGLRTMSAQHIDALFGLLSRPGLEARTYALVAQALANAQNPGLEPRLLRVLPSLPDAGKEIVVRTLAERREPAVIPYLRAMLGSNDPHVYYKGCLGMARVGNEESVREAIGCIGEVGRRNQMALPELLSELASTPAGTPLDLAALKGALPQPMSAEVATAYVMLIAARRDMSGVPELLALLPANLPPRYTGSPPPPLEALLRFDSTEVCQRARGEVERLHAAGQLDAKTYELVARVLDERLRLARATLAPTLGEAELMEALRAPDLERATQAAGRLGERGSEAALEVILEREDTRLIDAYARGAAFAGPRAMSTPHIDALFGLLSRPGLDVNTYWSIARALSYAHNPGLDPRLLRALPSLPDAARRIVVSALAEHREPAVMPYLRAMLASNDPNVHYEGCLGMARVGNEESVREAIGCIGEVGRQNENALPDLVSALASAPAGTPLDLAALKSVLPQPMSPFVTAAYCALIAARQDETGVPDLLALLPRELPRRYSSDLTPLDALLAFDSPAVWERTWDEVLRLYAAHQLDQQRYEIMIARIGSQSEHPDRVLAAHRETRAYKPFERERQALSARKADLVRLRRSDPERYLAEMEGYLAELRALADRYAEYAFSAGLRDEIAKETMWLADFARFTLRQPQKAIALYEQVAPVDGWASTRPLVRFLIGDIHQFDLADATGAIAAYLGALAEIDAARTRSSHGDAGALYAWWESWLEHEIAFLARGERFRGTVPSEALGGFMVNVGILLPTAGAGPRDASPWAALWPDGEGGRPDPGAFDRLPPSHMTLARMLPAVSLLPDADHIVHFLDRNDPGGYWVASFVALRQLAEREGAAGRDGEGAWGSLLGSFALEPMLGEKASPLAVAVQRLARGRGLGLTPPDRRLESPEATWALFLAALRAGDVESAVACFTVDRRPGMRAWLSRRSREELRALADSHAGFVITDRMGAYTEAGVARDSPHGKVLGLAYFVNEGGEWRVSEGP